MEFQKNIRKIQIGSTNEKSKIRTQQLNPNKAKVQSFKGGLSPQQYHSPTHLVELMKWLALYLLFAFLFFTDDFIQVMTFLKDFWFKCKHGPIYTGFLRNRWLMMEEVCILIFLSISIYSHKYSYPGLFHALLLSPLFILPNLCDHACYTFLSSVRWILCPCLNFC